MSVATSSLLEAVYGGGGSVETKKSGKIKRPPNAFLLYNADMRPILQAQNSGFTTSQISKMLSKGWSEMPPESKAKYKERERQLKAEFKLKHPNYKFTKTSKAWLKEKRKRKKEDKELRESRLKRPMNAFMLYNKEMRPILQEQNPNLTTGQISKMLGEGWKSLTVDQRQKYMNDASIIRENFLHAHPDYHFTRRPNSKRKRKGAREEEESEEEERPRRRRRRHDPRLPRHPKSGFFYYLDDVRKGLREKYPEKHIGEVHTIAGEMWNKLLPEDRKPYEMKSEEDKYRYKQELIVVKMALEKDGKME